MSTVMPTKPTKKSRRKRMLSPAAYCEATLPSLKLAESSRFARVVARVLFAAMVVASIVVAIAPWQQSVKGNGNVIAYAPLERQQTIESPIKGRILRLGDGVFENAHVVKNQLIAEVADIDSDYLFRLEAQVETAKRQLEASKSIKEANEKTLEAAKTIVTAFDNQIAAYTIVKEKVIAEADADIEAAKNKIAAAKQKKIEEEAVFKQAQADFDRDKVLYDERIYSLAKFQEAERKLGEAKAKVAQADEYIKLAQNELVSKERGREAKSEKAQVDIDYATAGVRKATADVNKAESDVAKSESEITKAEKLVIEAENKLARQKNQEIRAPFDGFLTSITANQGSQMLKEGDPICVIVPDTADRAVQIWLDGNDAPLVQPGRHVRVQFEGWPAVQFAGWPSVAVGTFGGKVISIDATDDGKGKFRALILPDEDSDSWPNERYLRQGVRANGWVLLDRVPLWYEIWRNMNGFPPVVSNDEPKPGSKSPKIPKP